MRKSIPMTLVAAALTLTLGLTGAVTAGEDPDESDAAADLRATEEAFARTMADRGCPDCECPPAGSATD